MPATAVNVCYRCWNRVPSDSIRYSPDGSICCETCWAEDCFRCARCGSSNWRLDRHTQEDGRLFCDLCQRSATWSPTPFDVSCATYTKIASQRKFGIELETNSCPNYQDLQGRSVYGAKYDCSVQGMEFYSPILYGDEGLAETEALCDLAAEYNWNVNNDCGYHLHLDMRNETSLQLRHIAYAYAKSYAAWRSLVSEWRANESSFCHAPSYSANDIRNERRRIVNFFSHTDRYNYLNLYAYECHHTFEVRLHDGTLHAKTINYWVCAHTRFCDAVRNLRYSEIDALFAGDARSQFQSLCGIWDRAGGQRISPFFYRRFRIHPMRES